MNKLLLITWAVATGCLLSGCSTLHDADAEGNALENQHEAWVKNNFEAKDTNGDGKISFEELSAATEKRMQEQGKAFKPEIAEKSFAKKDLNQDGFIDLDEMRAAYPFDLEKMKKEAARKAWLKENFDAIDADKDGMISRAELDASIKARKVDQGKPYKQELADQQFERKDLNQDGSIDFEEFSTMHDAAPKKSKGKEETKAKKSPLGTEDGKCGIRTEMKI